MHAWFFNLRLHVYTYRRRFFQPDRYLDGLGLTEGYLVLFSPTAGDWEKKLYMEEIVYNKKKITMVGL